MPRHKIRYVLPLLTMVASVACVDAAGPSEKAANAVRPKQEKNLCPEPIDQMDEDCLEITLLKSENKLGMKYEDLFRRAAIKGSKLHGLSKQYFMNVRSKWKVYKEELCSDSTIITDLRTPSDRALYLCGVRRTQHHSKALGRF